MPTNLIPKSVAEMFISSGGANGTRVSPQGFIEPAVAPRLDHDPVTKTAKGLLIESGRTNMLRYASRFDQTTGWNVNAAGGTPQVKVVPNAALAPNGHMEAAKFILSSQSNYGNGRVSQVAAKAATVGTYVASVYLKSAGGLRAFIYVCGTSSANSISANFDLLGNTHSSSKTGTFAVVSTSVTDAGNGWRRYVLVFTSDDTTGITYALYPSGAATGAGDNINGAFAWGAQLEAGTFATSYIPSVDTVTARASVASYYDAKGLVRYAAAGVGRMNYDPGNLVLAPALLTEPQRTNLVPNSSQTNRGAWSLGGLVAVPGKLAPDGTLRAVEFSGTPAGPLSQGGLIATSTEMTFSVYVKNVALTSALSFLLRNDTTTTNFTPGASLTPDGNGGLSLWGEGWTMKAVGNGWYRLSYLRSVGFAVGDSLRIYTGIVGGAADRGPFQIFGAQLEDGPMPTSYIPSNDAFTSRASTGTYFDAQGKIQVAAANVARMSYNPADLSVVPVLLQESASTNLFVHSEFKPGLSAASIQSGVSAVALNWLGLTTGISFPTLPSGTPYVYVGQTPSLTANTTYVVSAFVKMDDGLPPVVGRSTSAENDFALVIANSAIPFNSYTIENVGGDVYRVIARYTTGAAVPMGNCGLYKYAANTSRSFKVTGFQLEQASFASSYIPTTTAAVARAADVTNSTAGARAADTVASTAVARSSDFVYLDTTKGWFNSAEGSVALEMDVPKMPDVTVRNILELGDGNSASTSWNRVSMGMTAAGGVYWSGIVNGTTVATSSAGDAGTLPAGSYFKVALAYGVDGVRFSFRTDALRKNAMPTLPPMTRLALGAVAWGTNQACFHIKSARYFPQRLTDAEVSALTA